MLTRWSVGLTAAALIGIAGSPAFAIVPEDPKAPPPAAAAEDPEDAFLEIQSDVEIGERALQKKLESAKDDAERGTIYMAWQKERDTKVRQAIAIADQHLGKELGFEVLNWAATQRVDEDGVFQRLADHYADREELTAHLDSFQYQGSPAAATLLEKMGEHAKDDATKGRVLLAHAFVLKNQSENGDDAARQKAIEAFSVVEQKYPAIEMNGEKGGDIARTQLFELQNLAIGQPCPEIEGKDVDGVAFKLSDYKGKVVFLDFWGFW